MRRDFFEEAYRKFWDFLEEPGTPRYQSNSYELCDLVGKADWSIPFVGLMVDGERRESINELNAWRRNLDQLEVWSEILKDYDENDAWSLRSHFVEPLVHFCMHQPSSTRDRLAQVATNGIHQANLSSEVGYKDALDQDRLTPGQFLGRKKTEKQLERLAKQWNGADRLLSALQRLDSESHRQQTSDYRNQSSHFIAPRLEIGEVQFVTRTIEPATHMVQQPDESYRLEEIEGKRSVAYGFGGIRPLTLNEIIETNSRECHFAIAALDVYSDLLREILTRMDERKKTKGT